MPSEFVKFPHTPHLTWLSGRPLREGGVLSDSEAKSFLQGDVIIEEKVDGANIGISVSAEHALIVQNRGAYIDRPMPAQFQPLGGWLASRSDQLLESLNQSLILFGEWCYAVHSIRYDRLPDWFIGFDVYDRATGKFFSADRRNKFLSDLRLFSAPRIASGHYSLAQVLKLLGETHSAFGSSSLEGLYLRRESAGWLEQRTKIVRPEFTQAISYHWSSRSLTRNSILR